MPVRGVLTRKKMLVLTSALFAMPAILGVLFSRPWFASLYGALAVVSTTYHYTKNRAWLYLDYPLCYSITILLAHEAFCQRLMPMFLLGGGAVFILFWGGWVSRRMVFSPHAPEKLAAHSLMHLIVNLSACALLLHSSKSAP
jgi:hypothetical protein